MEQNNTALLQALAPVDKLQKANAAAALKVFQGAVIEAEGIRDIVPSTIEELEVASGLSNRLSKILKDIEEKRTEMKKPFSDMAKTVDNMFRPIREKIEELIQAIRRNMKLFTDAETKRRQEEADKAARIEEGRRRAQETREAKGMTVKPVEQIAPVARPVSLKSETSIRLVRQYRFEIKDYDAIREDWKKADWRLASLDTMKIRAAQVTANKAAEEAVKKGEASTPLDIPGLRLWNEDLPY
jgi:hypothetical protein